MAKSGPLRMLLRIVCFISFSAIGVAETSNTDAPIEPRKNNLTTRNYCKGVETGALAGEFAELRGFLAITPKARLDAAVKAFDFRVLMVEGYLLEVPAHAQVQCYGVGGEIQFWTCPVVNYRVNRDSETVCWFKIGAP